MTQTFRTRAETLFVSHGSPSLLLDDCPARTFLQNLSTMYHRPKAILVISAHWDTTQIKITSGIAHETIYDFQGFQPELYDMRYPAQGNPDLAGQIKQLLSPAFDGVFDPQRGLDHGAWVPLMLMYPEADITVLQLSINRHADPAHHFAIGQALKPLREHGVMILASGSSTHNLREMIRDFRADQPPSWVASFNEWLADKLEAMSIEELFRYTDHPDGLRNHPTPDHILPLFVALGAGDGQARRLHQSYTYGVLGMDAYEL